MYTDLVLRVTARTSDDNGIFPARLNSDTTANYSNTRLNIQSTASSMRNTSSTSMDGPIVNISSMTSNTFSSSELYFPNYTSTGNKPYSIVDATETNATTGFEFGRAFAGLYRGTNGINAISFTGNFVAGSSFHLYGISNT